MIQQWPGNQIDKYYKSPRGSRENVIWFFFLMKLEISVGCDLITDIIIPSVAFMFVLAPLSHLSVLLCTILIVSKHPNIVLWDQSDNRWHAGKVVGLFLDHQIVISSQRRQHK